MTAAEVGVYDIKRLALRGGLAKLVSQAGSSALRLSFMIVAARLLEPKDFGLVAMVTAVTAILDLFATAGLSSAAVQKSVINNKQISTLFWINILVGIALSLLCLLIAPLVVTFYHEPRLFWVTVAMGAAFLFNAAGVQVLALLQRQMRYVTLATIEFSSQLTSLAIGICLALAGFGYWALVAAAIALPATMTVCAWLATSWIPGRPSWSSDIRSMLHFGGTVTLNGLVIHIAYNFDKFILGRVWGADALGHYGVAFNLINIPTLNLNMALGSVAFSALSRLQNDAIRFRNYFLKGYSLNVSLTLPITLFAGIFANDIILVALGPKWSDSVEIFQLLAPAVLVFGIINPLGWLLWPIGKHVRSLEIAFVIAALVITGCLIGLPYGPKGVAAGFSAAMVVWLLPHVVWTVHGTNITSLDVLRATSRPLISALVALALAWIADVYLGSVLTPFFRLVLAGGVMAISYSSLMVFVMGRAFYLDLLKGMRNHSAPSTGANEVSQLA